jgi:hypothetical protein
MTNMTITNTLSGRNMRRLLVLAVAVTALTGCAIGAAPERSHAAVLVGIGEQDTSFFGDPLFEDLNVKRARVFVPWNVAKSRSQRRYLTDWLATAESRGVEPLVAFSVPHGSKCPRRRCKLPSVRAYKKMFRAFRKRWPDVKVVSPWNEANHRSQPTFRNPKRAAQYYNVVRKYCRGCKVVAADVIDERNMESWLKVFKRYARKPRIWGLHNYRDTNIRKGQRTGGTKRMLRTVRCQVWLTETGGLVKFILPGGRCGRRKRGCLFPKSTRRANTAIKRMFRLARSNRRIKRLYIYNWKQPGTKHRFDAGLVSSNGKARPGYKTVKRTLRTSRFN